MKNLEVFINPATNRNSIYIIARSGHKVIDIDRIILCKAERNYSKIILIDGDTEIVIPKSLCFLERILIKYHFLRCSSSHMINLNISGSFNRKLRMIFITDYKISVPRKRCCEVFPLLTAFGFKEELRQIR